MYEFVNTQRGSGTADPLSLPCEALSFDGIYLEREIQGYQTLYVSGREILESEISALQIGNQHGQLYQSRRYPARMITVGYRLMAKDAAEFRESFNQMNRLLSKEQAQMVFADEPDKYFVGTCVGSGADGVSPGTNSIVSELSFVCSDPFKYSTTLKEVPFTITNRKASVSIYNEGSCPAELEYTFNFPQENGFIAIASDQGAMEFGCKEENDVQLGERQTTATQATFTSLPNDSNPYYLIPNYHTGLALTTRSDNFATDKERNATVRTGLTITGMSGQSTSAYCSVGQKTYTLPSTRQDIELSFLTRFVCENNTDVGDITVSFVDASNNVIMALKISKHSASSGKGRIRMYVDGQQDSSGNDNPRHDIPFQASGPSNPFRPWAGFVRMTKRNQILTFYVGDKTYQASYPQFMRTHVAKIQISMGAPHPDNCTLADLRIYDLSLSDWAGVSEDIKNRYSAGSTVQILDGKIYTNGVYTPQDEVVGSEYFDAPVGTSTIKINTSSWMKGSASGYVRWRERWL